MTYKMVRGECVLFYKRCIFGGQGVLMSGGHPRYADCAFCIQFQQYLPAFGHMDVYTSFLFDRHIPILRKVCSFYEGFFSRKNITEIFLNEFPKNGIGRRKREN